jgi:hypothetical protein
MVACRTGSSSAQHLPENSDAISLSHFEIARVCVRSFHRILVEQGDFIEVRAWRVSGYVRSRAVEMSVCYPALIIGPCLSGNRLNRISILFNYWYALSFWSPDGRCDNKSRMRTSG